MTGIIAQRWSLISLASRAAELFERSTNT